jgi:hypothetical protein
MEAPAASPAQENTAPKGEKNAAPAEQKAAM